MCAVWNQHQCGIKCSIESEYRSYDAAECLFADSLEWRDYRRLQRLTERTGGKLDAGRKNVSSIYLTEPGIEYIGRYR